MTTPGLVILIVACAVLLSLGLAVYFLRQDYRAGQKRRLLERVAPTASGTGQTRGMRRAEPEASWSERLVGLVLDLEALKSLFAAAQVPIPLERFLALSLGLGVLLLLPLMDLTRDPLIALPALPIAMTLPLFYLMHRKHKREQALVEQLPEALDMMIRALRIGHSVDGALQEAGRGFPPPIGTEIKTIYEEMAMGLPFDKALRGLEGRFPSVLEVKILCAAFIVQRETGGNLTSVLERVAKTVRERFQFQRQVQVLTAEGRTSSLILGTLPIAFGLTAWLFNPDYFRLLYEHPLGSKLLLLAIVFEATGFLVMRRMSRIEA